MVEIAFEDEGFVLARPSEVLQGEGLLLSKHEIHLLRIYMDGDVEMDNFDSSEFDAVAQKLDAWLETKVK